MDGGLHGKHSNFYSTVTENIQLDLQRARIIGPTTRTNCRVNGVTPDPGITQGGAMYFPSSS
jgi:hypothetical protein